MRPHVATSCACEPTGSPVAMASHSDGVWCLAIRALEKALFPSIAAGPDYEELSAGLSSGQ